MEYRNLQDNIGLETYNDRIRGILKWIQENRNEYEWAKDPNAFEMANIFLLGAKYASEGHDVDLRALKQIWEIRKPDFQNAGVSNNSFVYAICEDAYNASQNKRAVVNDEASHHSLRKMAGIGLWLSQQKKKGEKVRYDNPQELMELLEASRTLKGIHPDLFDKYKFMDNLKAISRLQPENALSNRINDELAQLQSEKSIGENLEQTNSKEDQIHE